MSQNLVVFNHFDCLGKLGTEVIAASCLRAATVALVSLSATKVLVPTPNVHASKRVDEGLSGLPRERRGIVKKVDEDGRLFTRVIEYLRPLHEQATMWPESAFVDSSLESLYQIILGRKYKASVISSDKEGNALSLIPIINPLKFTGEARYRLAEICSVFTAFNAYRIKRLDLVAEILDPLVRQGLDDMLSYAEYNRLTSTAGRLGYVRRPDLALRRIARIVRNIVSSNHFKFLVKAGTGASEIAGHPIPTLAEILDRPKPGRAFNPPLLELPITTEYKIYRESLTSIDVRAKPQDGYIHVVEDSITGGIGWLQAGEESKISYDVNLALRYKKDLIQKALESSHRMAQGE